MSQRVSVLALGNWGTALANHLACTGHDVLGWSIDSSVVSGINENHRNPLSQSATVLHERFRATASLEEALESRHIVLAFPSQALSEMTPKLKASDGTVFISAIKGLERKTLGTPLQYLEKNLPVKGQLSVLSGPSFAKDIIVCNPSGLVAASKKEEIAREVATLFSSDWMKVYVSTDPIGVEYGGILKNVIAIAVGVADGLQLGDSARAGLITRGIAEMMRFAEAYGGKQITLSGLSGLGDLVMTSSCDASRNRTVGLRLGQGESLKEIINSLGSVAEGVETAPLVARLAGEKNVEMPITSLVVALIEQKIKPQEMARALITRPTRKEF